MAHYFQIPIIALFAFFTVAAGAQQSDGWALKGTKDGVNVYYRDQASSVQEIKLVTTLDASLAGITQLLTEVDLYPKWGYKIVESRVIKQVSDHEAYYYSRIDFPWPLSDRDVVMHAKLTQHPTTHVITAISKAMPDYIPAVKDVVRIRQATTKWTIRRQNADKLAVEYYINSDPGGNLPDWLVNMAIDVGPRETIKNMRGLLSQNRYRQARIAHIISE